MTVSFPVFPGQNGQSNATPGPLPNDLRVREGLLLDLIPQHVLRGAVIDVIADAPIVPTAAVLDSAVQNFSLAGGGTFEFVVDGEYDGVNAAAGAPASLQSARQPAVALLAANDRIQISIAGEAAQTVEIGAQATGAAIAAALQAAVRVLVAASPQNQAAYASFACTYSPVTVSKLLKSALLITTQYTELTLDNVQGLRRGQVLTLQGSTDEEVTITDIDWSGNKISVEAFTTLAAHAVDEAVDSADDYYLLTTGKYGVDMSIVVTNGLTENAADLLKLRAADGAAGSAGTDAVGVQTVPYADTDFVAPAAATAAEVVVVINKVLTGAIATVSATKVRLTSRRLGVGGSVRAVVGHATTKLGYAAVAQTGTETDIVLSLDSPTLTAIVPFTKATGALGSAYLGSALEAVARMRRKNLENIGGADEGAGATLGWIVVSKPSLD